MNAQKVCVWDLKGKKNVICDAENYDAPCSGQCSNANINLARYAMCPGSDVCGMDTIFMDQIQDLEAQFTNENQLCVYKIIFSEFDPLDALADIKLDIQEHDDVQAQLFS